MLNENKTLTVITSALLHFEVEACGWEPASIRSDTGGVQVTVKVYRAEPGRGTPPLLVAEFADVHAVYCKDGVTLVTPDEGD
jgi:hypothetical protein